MFSPQTGQEQARPLPLCARAWAPARGQLFCEDVPARQLGKVLGTRPLLPGAGFLAKTGGCCDKREHTGRQGVGRQPLRSEGRQRAGAEAAGAVYKSEIAVCGDSAGFPGPGHASPVWCGACLQPTGGPRGSGLTLI